MNFRYLKLSAVFCFSLLAAAGFFSAPSAQAGSVSLEASSYWDNGEKLYELKAFADSGGKEINVLAGEMRFSESDLELVKTTYGGSIINHWVERPTAGGSPIRFSGGIAGGLATGKGYIFSAIFKKASGSTADSTQIVLEHLSEYLNDSRGTKSGMEDHTYTLYFDLGEPGDFSPDIQLPEVFAPYVYFDQYVESGKWVVFFNAQDKGEGVDYYGIFESLTRYDLEALKNMEGIGWEVSDGLKAYILKDQNLSSYIYIKAVDKNGNVRITEVVPAESRAPGLMDNRYLVIGLFFLIGIIAILFFIFWKRRKDKEEEEKKEVEEYRNYR